MVDSISRQRGYGSEPVAQVFKGVSIGDIHNPNIRKNLYVVYVKFMHGDADGYETEECEFQLGDEEHMLEFLNFLALCSVKYPHGKGGCDDYTRVPGYNRWVESYEYDEDEMSEEEFEALADNQILEWPFWEGEYCASYDGAHVVFFNEEGIRHSVNLIEA